MESSKLRKDAFIDMLHHIKVALCCAGGGRSRVVVFYGLLQISVSYRFELRKKKKNSHPNGIPYSLVVRRMLHGIGKGELINKHH